MSSIRANFDCFAVSTKFVLPKPSDYIWNLLSAQPAFYNLRTPDFSYMDVDPNTHVARPCTQVFDSSICNDPAYAGKSNSYIFLNEFPSHKNTIINGVNQHDGDGEVFAEMFEHLELNQADPFLEQPLGVLPQESSYVQGLINNPPGPTN